MQPSSTRRFGWKRESLFVKARKVTLTFNSLLSLLKLVIGEPDETTKRMLCDLIQRLLAKTQTRLNANPSTRTDHPVNQDGEESPSQLEEVNLEEFSIQFLCIYSTQPHWRQVVSSPNRHGQTLAHISVTLGYFQLLQHLFKWEIDINTTDKMGLTALHYAYLFKQEECARFLIHSGANPCILDGLGRSPSDLNPSLGTVLHSVMDIDDNSNANHALPIEGHHDRSSWTDDSSKPSEPYLAQYEYLLHNLGELLQYFVWLS